MDNFDQDEFGQWCNLWDQALDSQEFKSDGVQVPDVHKNFDGDDTAQDHYWNHLEEESGLLTEDKTPNPIYPDSVGKDQDNPKPAWVKEDVIEEIAGMKRKLYDLEVKLGEEDGGNGKWVEKCHHPNDSKIMSQIEEMKKKIDTLSDKLGMEDEDAVSQWDTASK